jgi:hypothetical protein
MQNKWMEAKIPKRAFKLKFTRSRPIRLNTRWFSQVLEDIIKRGKQMRYWEEIEGKNKDCTYFLCINFYKLEMMPEVDKEVLFKYLKTLDGLLLDFCTET